MLLQRLEQYADRIPAAPTLYREMPVRYLIEIDATGRFLGMTDTADPNSPRTKRGQPHAVPEVTRSSGIRAFLLADKADYVLGYVGGSEKPDKVPLRHQAFRELVDHCAAATAEPAVLAVQQFLADLSLDELPLDETFNPADRITFRVDYEFVVDLPAVQAFWATENDPASKDAPIMQCLVRGHQRPVLKRLQGKIKGVPGGQTAGTSLISANAEAFESYGLSASLIAPTCAVCAERFTRAINALLANDAHHLVLAGAVFVFWTREEVGFNIRGALSDPQPEEVQQLLNSVRTGKRVPEVDDTQFYAAVLSGSGGRAVVRDWIDTTVGEVKKHFGKWFQRQWILGPVGEEPRPLGLYSLAGATARELRDVPTPTFRALIHAALTGTPLPLNLLYQAVRRGRAERAVTRQRAALIKLVLLSQPDASLQEETLVQLDPAHPSPAYHCGRLLAVLEQAQRLAVPGIKATLVDRFFGTASSAPASVFGRLLRGAQPHLAKLERDRPGAYHALQQRLEEVQAPLAGFPRTLSLEEQGLFALGYYHQRAWDRARAKEAAERRRAGQAPAPDAQLADAFEPQIDETDSTEEND